MHGDQPKIIRRVGSADFTFPGVLRSVLLEVGHGHRTLLSGAGANVELVGGWVAHGASMGSTPCSEISDRSRSMNGSSYVKTRSLLQPLTRKACSALPMLGRNAGKECFACLCVHVRASCNLFWYVIYIYIDLYIYLYTVAEICISLRIDHCSAS